MSSGVSVVVLALEPDPSLVLTVDGEDEATAMQALVDLIDDKFGEGE